MASLGNVTRMTTAIARSTLCHKETTWDQCPRFARLLIKAWTFRGARLVNLFASDGGSKLAATAFGKHCGAPCELTIPRPLTVSSPFFSLMSSGSTLSTYSTNCPSWTDSSGIELGHDVTNLHLLSAKMLVGSLHQLISAQRL
jgi:hypothetical protein